MDNQEYPVEYHLQELRRDVIVFLVPALLILIPLCVFSGRIVQCIFLPLKEMKEELYCYCITDGLMLRIRSAVTLDLLLTAPWAACLIFSFMKPGLYRNEKLKLRGILFAYGVLFYAALGLFALKLAPVLTETWCRSTVYASYLSAGRYYSIWQTVMLLFAAVCAALPFGVWAILHYREEKQR